LNETPDGRIHEREVTEGLDEPILPAEGRSRLLLPLLLGKGRSLWPWLIVAALVWLGWHELRQIDVAAVRTLLRATDPNLLLVLLAATVLNLAVFGLYDVIALGPLSRPPTAAARWSVGVVSFAWSNFLTIGPLAGPALRLWLYAPMGVEGRRARSALTSILTAFSLLLLGWCGASALPLPAALDTLAVRIALGVPAAALAAAALAGLRRLPFAPPALRNREGSATALAAVAGVDWLIAFAVFHLALAGTLGDVDPRRSLPAFFLGQLVGLVSFIPGGLGSADAFWLIALGGEGAAHVRVLAALILYRAVYYVLPWAFATLLLAGRFVRAGRRTGALLRSLAASYTFLCGAVLLASAATPSLAERAAFLKRSAPLAIVEASHGVSVVLGFLLLVISRGLARGYRSSQRLALALFLAGALTTFLKGLDYEEALLSLGAVAFLMVFHRSFERTGTLRPSVEFVVSSGLFALALFGGLGFGSHSSLPEASAAFGRFEHLGHAERFLRGLFVLASITAVVTLHVALRSRARDALPDESQIARALADVRAFARGTGPMLVAGGDKAIFRSEAAPDDPDRPPAPLQGFIAYRTSGRFLVAYSDPVCPPGSERALLAAFLELAAASDRDVVLYQIPPAFLPVAHDFGFTFFKLGEEAVVDLVRFDLKGNKAKSWRHAVNSAEKAGVRFEIVKGEGLRPLLPDLRQVSDAWLAERHAVEKQFSIGRFDETYLMRFPCALVRESSGRVIGFANVFEGPRGEELSIDLMRYRSVHDDSGSALKVMDYLLLELMLHGKDRGFRRFNLGMAPLSAVGEVRWARPFERLAHLFFRHGEHWYNYQGLRRYKEKFDPVWEPRYMAYPKPWDWPLATASAAVLIAGGWSTLLFPARESR